FAISPTPSISLHTAQATTSLSDAIFTVGNASTADFEAGGAPLLPFPSLSASLDTYLL
ncbi:hypothetical protein A2U01_0099835, partial [Trifolium medium]|nr:hypothetical protein [Trifolium medium]